MNSFSKLEIAYRRTHNREEPLINCDSFGKCEKIFRFIAILLLRVVSNKTVLVTFLCLFIYILGAH